MKIKKIGIIIVGVLMIVTGLLFALRSGNTEHPEDASAGTTVIQVTTTAKPQLVVQEQTHYEQLHNRMDAGDSTGFADYLLEQEVSPEVFAWLQEEAPAAVERLLVDALVFYAQNDQMEQLVLLRRNGYLSDTCLLNYWEVMGSRLPEERASEIDYYLVHELHMAYQRDSYVIRSYKQMRATGILDDEIHAELVSALGFDYTDDDYMEEHDIAPLQGLNVDEKETYEDIWETIDQGDCVSIVKDILYGHVTEQVYTKLMEENAEVMNYVIAQGMAELAASGSPENVVRLRQSGFVSDTCFENYWEMMNCGIPGDGYSADNLSGEDGYLLFELEQIYYRNDNGKQILQNIWYSGMINDTMCYYLIDCLGFDFTQN